MKEENNSCNSFEQVMVNRLMKLTNAMDEEDGDTFDRTSATLELWIKSNIPEIYDSIMERKTPLDQATDKALQKITVESRSITDKFAQEAYRSKEQYSTVWDYRAKYFELILDIISRNGFIPFTSGYKAEMKGIHDETDN